MWIRLLYEAGVPLALGAWLLIKGEGPWHGKRGDAVSRIWHFIRPGTLGWLLVIFGVAASLRIMLMEHGLASTDDLQVPAAARGQVKDDAYENHYFSFRLPLGEQWKAQPPELFEEAAKKSPNRSGSSSAELTLLGYPPGFEEQPIASITIAIERLPQSTDIDDSKEYLQVGLQRILAGANPPRTVDVLPDLQSGGNTFSACRVARVENDVPFSMLLLATKKDDFVLILSGTFGDDDGESLVHDLLDGLK